jgi:hypothetical protein
MKQEKNDGHNRDAFRGIQIAGGLELIRKGFGV